MFNCAFCRKPVGPRVSPHSVVVRSRAKEYVGVDEKGEPVLVGVGEETVEEHLQCPSCGGRGTEQVQTQYEQSVKDRAAQLALGYALQQHGKKCKERLIEDCPTCKKNMRLFLEIPDDVINLITTEPPTRKARPSLASVVMDRLIERSNHITRSKRAEADYAAGYMLLKAYEEAGGSL